MQSASVGIRDAKMHLSKYLKMVQKGPWRRIYTWPEWSIVRTLSAKWPLRGADLWHLAAAVTLRKEIHELKFLTFDQRLKQAAAGEALL
jgi:protein involved in temperature-dependent protein secretion